jgi:hypothetical protein
LDQLHGATSGDKTHFRFIYFSKLYGGRAK